MANEPLDLIDERLAEIKAERKTLDKEEAGLIEARKHVARLVSRPKKSAGKTDPKTHKEYTLSTLRNSEKDWFDSVSELRDAVAADGKNIKLTSFQPMISDMVNSDKTIVRNGSKIGLAERVGP